MTTERAKDWVAENRDLFWDLLRVYVGACLFIKGIVYLRDASGLVETMRAAGFPFPLPAVAQWIALTHIAGGLLLFFGMLTRLAAAIQLPNVIGAVFLVHLKAGLFTQGQTLEFATLILVVLGLFCAVGAGRWSIDYHFRTHTRRELAVEHLSELSPQLAHVPVLARGVWRRRRR